MRRAEALIPALGFVTAVDKGGQVNKGTGWMSWHREATKDAAACDKPRLAGKRALIRGCPNEETQQGLIPLVTLT